MDIYKALILLKSGPDAIKKWNRWRDKGEEIPNLNGTYLSGAYLSEADLRVANLRGADLRNADLRNADLRNADLRGAELSIANLNGAKLLGANFRAAHLRSTDLSGANLSNAHFISAHAYRANLQNVNLQNADLRWSILTQSNLSGANLTGAKLYSTARDDWIIEGVKCDYVFWDELGEQRSPKDRNLAPGEFEQLYAALPNIEYIFQNGMSPIDPLIMDHIVGAIRDKNPDFDIKIDSINARGLAPSIKFTVLHEEQKAPALAEIQTRYEQKIAQLESERDRYYTLVSQAIATPRDFKLINAAPGSIVATDGSTVNIEQHINHAVELQKAIAQAPPETLTDVAKKTALNLLGEALKDIAKGQIKQAARQIVDLAKDLSPLITTTAAYAFFKNQLGG